mgnify:FL=1|tara:strand:+ start:293 stop:544 length:252 start_codon:yes stop_codon:yes gene_type:complete
MSNPNTVPTKLERLHYTEDSKKRIVTARYVSTKTLLGHEVLLFKKHTRDGTLTNEILLISVELITKRVPLVSNLKYATLEPAQ